MIIYNQRVITMTLRLLSAADLLQLGMIDGRSDRDDTDREPPLFEFLPRSG
jgi:hypothetical protein